MTVLTGFSLLYWLFSMFVGDGFDFLDADVEVSADIPDVDAPDGGEVSVEPSLFSKAMEFINVGKVPIMVVLTLFKFIGWIITICSSLVFDLGKWGMKSVFILIPIFILTYFILHWVTKPLAQFYHKVGYNGEEAIDFLGRKGKMKSSIEGTTIGSAEFTINNDVIRLHVVSKDGLPIHYNDQVTVVDESPDRRFYYIQKELSLDTI